MNKRMEEFTWKVLDERKITTTIKNLLYKKHYNRTKQLSPVTIEKEDLLKILYHSELKVFLTTKVKSFL